MMAEDTEVVGGANEQHAVAEGPGPRSSPYSNDPTNAVHARVGDDVLASARAGVKRGERPEDIIRRIIEEYRVRLSLGELRLLLASRHRPPADDPPPYVSPARPRTEDVRG